MDIETRLYLRSFVKPDTGPILKAIVGALLIHSLLWINWSVDKNTTVAEIPDWFNVKLIAGIEPAEKKTEKTEVKKLKSKTAPLKEILPHKNDVSEKVKNKNVKKASATTFVAADSQPYMLENPKPVYPTVARRRGMQGIVLLKVEVNSKGHVENITILQTSGYKVLDRSAVNSVEHWRFIPAKRGDDVVSSVVEIPIKFILKEV